MEKDDGSAFNREMYERREEKILTSSLAVFDTKGCFGYRVEDVAAEAGVPKGSLYAHYESKTEILQSTSSHLESWVVAQYRRRAQTLPPGEPLASKLALIAEILLDRDTHGKSPGGVAAFCRLRCALENLGVTPEGHALEDLVVSLIEEALRLRLLRRDFPPSVLAHIFLTSVGTFPMRHLADGDTDNPQQVSRKLVDLFLRGAGLPPGGAAQEIAPMDRRSL